MAARSCLLNAIPVSTQRQEQDKRQEKAWYETLAMDSHCIFAKYSALQISPIDREKCSTKATERPREVMLRLAGFGSRRQLCTFPDTQELHAIATAAWEQKVSPRDETQSAARQSPNVTDGVARLVGDLTKFHKLRRTLCQEFKHTS